MKYIIVDNKDGDLFTTEFNTAEEAIKEADKQFNYLTEHDKKHRQAFYVLESVNPDEDADNHFDGNPIKEYI